MKTKRKSSGPLMLFQSRPKFCGTALHPMTAGRIVILEERGNPIVLGVKEGDTITQDHLFEILVVVAMDDQELAEFSVDADDRDWKIKAREFSMGLTPDDVVEFWELIEREKSEIEASRAEPKKKQLGQAKKSSTKKRATPRTGG